MNDTNPSHDKGNVAAAVIAWWEENRPLGWAEEDHVAQATVNCETDAEQALARLAAQLVRATPPSPSTAPEVDERHEFERWMSQRGESAVYIGDGLYSTGAVCDQAEAFAAGIAIGRAARASRPLAKLDPALKAALEEAAKTGATSAVLPGGEAVFINRGHDYGDNAHLECTACGGSGHIDDQRAALASRPAEVDDEGLPNFLAPATAWMVGRNLYLHHDAIPAGLLPPIGNPEPLFSVKQFRQSQRDAVAADRARRAEVDDKQDWRALGYVEGATVRREIGSGRIQYALITCAHGNGALDVEVNGLNYGWSARHCTVVPAPGAKRTAN